MNFPLTIDCHSCSATIEIPEEDYVREIRHGHSPTGAIDEILVGEHGWEVDLINRSTLCSNCKETDGS
jgi:hypothetical protein